jgi:hypothetical protein
MSPSAEALPSAVLRLSIHAIPPAIRTRVASRIARIQFVSHGRADFEG